VVRPRLADFPFTRDVGLLFGGHADAGLRDRSAIRILVDVVESRSADGFARHAV
jgi:hypothetical protein